LALDEPRNVGGTGEHHAAGPGVSDQRSAYFAGAGLDKYFIVL